MDFKFEKKVLAEIEKCYAVLGLTINNEPMLIYGGEGNGSLSAFHGPDFKEREIIWEGGGGTMSIVPAPERPDSFFASRGFYSMVNCENSTVEWVRYQDHGFTYQTVAQLDYLHRFDILKGADGTQYIFAAALHSGKADKEDWSKPGHMFAAVLPKEIGSDFRAEFVQLPGEFYMNHGFCKTLWQGHEAALTASREGVFLWIPPEHPEGSWQMEKLLDTPTSDIALTDIDGDGHPELACLLPFHGNQCKVFRITPSGCEEIYEHSVPNDFYHAVISGKIKGETLFAIGARKETQELFLLRWDKNKKELYVQQLETGGGPSNLNLFNSETAGDLLLSANRMIHEAALFVF